MSTFPRQRGVLLERAPAQLVKVSLAERRHEEMAVEVAAAFRAARFCLAAALLLAAGASPAPEPSAAAAATSTHPATRLPVSPHWPASSSPLACAPPVWPDAGPGEEFRRVLVIGDSLTQGSMPALSRLLTRRGWLPTVRCWAGEDIAWGIGQVRSARRVGQLPRTVVVALGTNDLYARQSLVKEAHMLLTELGSDVSVKWVNLHLDTRFPGVPDSRSANRQLRQVRNSWANVRIVDFDAAMRARHADPKFRLTDGVHLSKHGYRLRSSLIAESLGRPGA